MTQPEIEDVPQLLFGCTNETCATEQSRYPGELVWFGGGANCYDNIVDPGWYCDICTDEEGIECEGPSLRQFLADLDFDQLRKALKLR